MNILNFSNEMLETILSYIPRPSGSYINEAGWKPKVLLPLRGINHRFARLIPRIALQKVDFEAHSAVQLLSFFDILGRTPLGCTDDAPYISYMKQLRIALSLKCRNSLVEADISNLLALSQYQGVFDSADRLERLELINFPWKAVGTEGIVGDLSFLNCPNLVSLKVRQYDIPFHNGLFLPLSDDATFPKLKDLDLEIRVFSAAPREYLEELGAGIVRRSLDRFAITDSEMSLDKFGALVLPHLHGLRELDLISSFQPNAAVCAKIVKYCRKLESLYMHALDDACVEALCSEVPATSSQMCFTNSIQNINTFLGDITTASISHLKRLPRLTKFEIRVMEGGSKEDQEMLQRALPGVVKIHHYR